MGRFAARFLSGFAPAGNHSGAVCGVFSRHALIVAQRRYVAEVCPLTLYAAMNSALRFSRAGFTLVEIMIVVVIIGLLATLALPAWQKIRSASQDKAIFNNARQLSAAADQYYLETGSNFASASSLVGATNYVKLLNTVAHENYPVNFTQGTTITIANVGGARTVTYAP
jgi:type IV pilus assembly protein PilA